MPEARLNLAQATIALAVAPKSNAVITAIDAASADVRAGKIGPVPAHLRDAHYAGAQKLGHGSAYVYSHDEPFGIAEQQYAPDVVADAALLPAHRPGRRGGGQGALGARPPADPWQRGRWDDRVRRCDAGLDPPALVGWAGRGRRPSSAWRCVRLRRPGRRGGSPGLATRLIGSGSESPGSSDRLAETATRERRRLRSS